jgi:hypothetical protein
MNRLLSTQQEERMSDLTTEQKATNYETIKHIRQVQAALNKIIVLLLERGRVHDKSKLEEPELSYFVEHTEKLKDLTYDSKEYKQNLDNIAPALNHHYANNRHHPQHFKNGIADMNIVDLVELLCDWSASCRRQTDGNLRHSIEANAKRFKIEPQLLSILENSIDLIEDVE